MFEKLTCWVKSLFVKPAEFQVQGGKRSSAWYPLRNSFLANKRCAVCNTDKDLEAHHKKPFHEYPELELDESNLVALCSRCHFVIGHLFNYSMYNHDIDNTITYFQLIIKKAKAHLKKHSSF
jgi:hypothetical protein